MGLDMYIYSAHKNVDPHTSKLYEEVYWRKANMIHRWFVDNIQKGIDDCDYYLLTKDNLETLKAICEKAIAEKDSSLLPPVDGFFFGNTTLDEAYWSDIEDTSNQLSKVVNTFDKDRNYYYYSNW